MTARAHWLRPLHRKVWGDPGRRAHKLLQFGEVEASGARDLFRAAELTDDAHLRRRLFAHARDEVRHADMFRARGTALRRSLPPGCAERGLADAMVLGERGLDELEVERESAQSLLAFIHLSECAALRAFTAYGQVLGHDPETRALMGRVASDERGHMTYSLAELARVSGGRPARALWAARLRRLWKAYLRVAVAVADRIAWVVLLAQYIVLLAPFAWLAKRAGRADAVGWRAVPAEPRGRGSQY